MLRRLVFSTALFAAAVASSACKQGLGDRCEVNSDCEDGLVCARLTQTCEETAQTVVDSGIDAPDIDAAVEPDAMVDAAPDAMVDAAPEPDAAP